MQSAQDWNRQNTADGLNGAGYRRILIQGQVRSIGWNAQFGFDCSSLRKIEANAEDVKSAAGV